MDVTYQKKNGETIQLLTETTIADAIFPVGFSFLSKDRIKPSFGKWTIEATDYAWVNTSSYVGNRTMYIIRRTE